MAVVVNPQEFAEFWNSSKSFDEISSYFNRSANSLVCCAGTFRSRGFFLQERFEELNHDRSAVYLPSPATIKAECLKIRKMRGGMDLHQSTHRKTN